MKLRIRYLIQFLFFIIIGSISINHTLSETGNGISWLSKASLHAICPFGGVVSLYNIFTDGTLIKKIHSSSVILMVIVFFTAILFGPAFCGWICPLGTIQELFGKIGKKIFKNSYNHIMPRKVDKILRYLRYIVLVWVVYVTAISGTLLFSNIDPFHALFNFWTGESGIISLFILTVTLALSILVERPWCKYACPYGALLGLSNLIRIFKLQRNSNTCINCKACSRNCPMNIEVDKNIRISNHQCISCLECTSEYHCPIKDTVTLSSFKGGENI